MATFEAGNAVPPSAIEQISSTFMWPVFAANNAAQSAGATGSSTPTKQLSNTSDYTRKKTK